MPYDKGMPAAPTRAQALKLARLLGCPGAHRHDDGSWMPCPSHEEMLAALKVRRRGQTRKRFERLRERRLQGIETLPGGGLVSAPVVTKVASRPALNDVLVALVREHNRNLVHPWQRTSLHAAKSVHLRAVVASDDGQAKALARVHAFLHLARTGAPKTADYVADNDLLSEGHPWREDATLRREAEFEVKRMGSRLSATPAPPKERIRGSARNVEGSARSTSAAREIEMDDPTVEALREKVRQHNEGVRDGRKVTLATLKAVYRRGAGAYSVSHRPGMQRGQWAMGRVNAFLKMLRSSRPDNLNYVNDNDLLPEDHPWRSKTEWADLEEKRIGGNRRLRRFTRRALRTGRDVRFNQDAYDGNSDGMVQDGTPWERPAQAIRRAREGVRRRILKRRGESPTNFGEMIEKLQDPDGGFSVRVSRISNVETGWAVARKGKALQMPVAAFLDEDGKATEMGKRRLLAYVRMLQDDFFAEGLPKGQRVVLGAWHEPFDEATGEGGIIHLDVTDVYPKKGMTKEQAFALGGRQDQKSVADLDAIAKGDWDNAIVDTGGTGTPGFDESALTPYLRELEEEFGPA